MTQHAVGFPGQYPFTRGIHANMYRGKLWTMRQFSGFGTPKETNERYHFLMKEGQMGLSVAYDMPTLMGYDPGHPFAEGEVGKYEDNDRGEGANREGQKKNEGRTEEG